MRQRWLREEVLRAMRRVHELREEGQQAVRRVRGVKRGG